MSEFSENDIRKVTICAESVLRVINDSLSIANQSKNLKTRDSRVRDVRDKLEELKKMTVDYPFLKIVGLADFEYSIHAVEAKTASLREKKSGHAGLNMADANAARLAVFRRNSDILLGVRQVSTFDNHTCLICIAYSGGQWDLEGNPINGTTLPFNGGPPHHFDCRSVLVGITKTFREMGIDVDEPKPSTRASDEGQISSEITFDEFLRRKSKAYVDEMLGVGRADLWRAGKIACRDLLDSNGRVMSLEELRNKFDV